MCPRSESPFFPPVLLKPVKTELCISIRIIFREKPIYELECAPNRHGRAVGLQNMYFENTAMPGPTIVERGHRAQRSPSAPRVIASSASGNTTFNSRRTYDEKLLHLATAYDRPVRCLTKGTHVTHSIFLLASQRPSANDRRTQPVIQQLETFPIPAMMSQHCCSLQRVLSQVLRDAHAPRDCE